MNLTPQQLTDKLRQEITTLQDRRDIALSETEAAEERRKIKLDSIDREAAEKRNELTSKLDEELAFLRNEVEEARAKRDEVIAHSDKLLVTHSEIETQVKNLNQQKTELTADITADNQLLMERDQLLSKTLVEIKKYRGQIDGLRAEVKDLDDAKTRMLADRKVLEEETVILEDKVMQLDTDFKARKEILETQIHDLQKKVEQSLDKLLLTESKDEEIRKNWAVEQTKLDKRAEAVRRKEVALGGAEARIAELQKYDVL